MHQRTTTQAVLGATPRSRRTAPTTATAAPMTFPCTVKYPKKSKTETGHTAVRVATIAATTSAATTRRSSAVTTVEDMRQTVWPRGTRPTGVTRIRPFWG